MSSNLRRIIAILILVSMFFYTVPVLAYTNEENVYVKLDKNGKPYKTIVSTVKEENGETLTSQEEKDVNIPIECEVSYYLDGSQISGEELIGKSGNVKIKIEYKNTLENTINVNGRNEKLYTPFLVLTAAVIDNENNSNVAVENGKAIDDGEKTMVFGYSMPGMEESLKLNEEDINIPSSVEISFTTKCFEMKNIMTYAMQT